MLSSYAYVGHRSLIRALGRQTRFRSLGSASGAPLASNGPSEDDLRIVDAIGRRLVHAMEQKDAGTRLYAPGAQWKQPRLLSEVQYSPALRLPSECPKCGIETQTEFPDRVGFIPKISPKAISLFEESPTRARDTAMCQRCFQIATYNTLVPAQVPYDSFREILAAQRDRDVLVVKVVDIFNFTGSIIPGFQELIGSKKLILIVNKIDLLPAHTSPERLERWLHTQCREYGINNVESIHFVSARTWEGVKLAWEHIHKRRGGRDVVVCGMANVGKSSFVNNILRMLYPKEERELAKQRAGVALIDKEIELSSEAALAKIERAMGGFEATDTDIAPHFDMQSEEAYKGIVPDTIMSSPFPNTTLGVLRVPLDKRSFLIDTPGVAPPLEYRNLQNFLLTGSPQERRMYLPEKQRVRPTTYHLRPGKSLIIGSMAVIDWSHAAERDIMVTCFFPNAVTVHMTSTRSAMFKREMHRGELFVPPVTRARACELGDIKEVLRFPLQDLHLLPGEGAPAYCRVRNKSSENLSHTGKTYRRTALLDICLGSFGWVAFTVPAYDRTHAYWETVDQGLITAHAVQGVVVEPRSALLPFEASGKSAEGSAKNWRRKKSQSK